MHRLEYTSVMPSVDIGARLGHVDWLCLTHKEPQPLLVLGVFLLPSSLYLAVRRPSVVFPPYSLPTGIVLLFSSLLAFILDLVDLSLEPTSLF